MNGSGLTAKAGAKSGCVASRVAPMTAKFEVRKVVGSAVGEGPPVMHFEGGRGAAADADAVTVLLA